MIKAHKWLDFNGYSKHHYKIDKTHFALYNKDTPKGKHPPVGWDINLPLYLIPAKTI